MKGGKLPGEAGLPSLQEKQKLGFGPSARINQLHSAVKALERIVSPLCGGVGRVGRGTGMGCDTHLDIKDEVCEGAYENGVDDVKGQGHKTESHELAVQPLRHSIRKQAACRHTTMAMRC